MVESIRDLRKLCGEVPKNSPWREKLARAISIRITKLFLILFPSIMPNPITILMVFVGLVSVAFFIPGSYIYSIIGVLLLQLHLILDACDGEIARYKKVGPKYGTGGIYLDYMAHLIINPLLIMAISVGAYFSNPLPIPSYIFLIAGISGMYFMMLNNLAKLKKMEMGLDKNDWKMLKKMKIKQGYSPKNPIVNEIWYLFRIITFNSIFFFGILNLLPYLVLIYGLLLPLQAIRRVYSEFKS